MPAALARYTGAGRQAARRLARLVRAGLVRQQPDGGGEIALVLTPAGQDRLRDDPLQAVREAAGAAGPESGLPEAPAAPWEGPGARFGTCPTCHHFAALEAGGGRCRLFRARLTAEDTGQLCAAHLSETGALIAAAARRHRARW